MAGNLIIPWSVDYEDYLHDESKQTGTADSISFPTSEMEVIETIKQAASNGSNITLQGARTGIVAGAVPQGGLILNLSRMNSMGTPYKCEATGGYRITVQPGATLDDIRKAISAENLFFPPDPTETTASIGGMASCNASGARSFFYGPTRNWVESLRVVLSDGSTLALRRGENFAVGRHFSVTTEQGRVIEGDLPSYIMPDIKSAAGYYTKDNMDVIDIFIGMEGTLGIITEITLKLIPHPKALAGLTIFMPDEESALKLVRVLRGENVDGLNPVSMRPVAIEFFNSNALDLLRKAKAESSAFSNIPALKPDFHTAVYAEFHGESDDELEGVAMEAMEAAMEMGASDEDTWFATTDRELEPQKAFRHATPEAVNLLIGERKRTNPDITKLGTDMSVPDEHLEAAINMYNADLQDAGLESVIFGHIGNNHVHVNILPRSMDEYKQGKALYLSWAERIVKLGGSVSAEHGIGKLKVPFLKMMYGETGIAEMQALKAIFDLGAIFNKGSLF